MRLTEVMTDFLRHLTLTEVMTDLLIPLTLTEVMADLLIPLTLTEVMADLLMPLTLTEVMADLLMPLTLPARELDQARHVIHHDQWSCECRSVEELVDEAITVVAPHCFRALLNLVERVAKTTHNSGFGLS